MSDISDRTFLSGVALIVITLTLMAALEVGFKTAVIIMIPPAASWVALCIAVLQERRKRLTRNSLS